MSLSPHGYRVMIARQNRTYESLRESLATALNCGFTYEEAAAYLGVSRSVVRMAVIVLELEVKKEHYTEERARMDLAEQRGQEHHWVRLFRDTYGPIGKGFSTA